MTLDKPKAERLMTGERQYIAHYVTQPRERRAEILAGLNRNPGISGPLIRAIRALEEML
jgi:hypothetical protein